MTQRAIKRIETDKKILDATIDIIGAKGYVNSNLREIASAAGVTQGLISQRFETKENLLDQAIRATNFVWNECNISADSTLDELFTSIIENAKKLYEKDEKAFEFVYTVSHSRDIPSGIFKNQRQFFEDGPFRGIMEKAQEAGYLPQGDVALLYNIFFCNTLRLIKDYKAANLNPPENKHFMATVQYRNPVEEELEHLRSCAFDSISQSFSSLFYFNIWNNTYRVSRTIEEAYELSKEISDPQEFLNQICSRFIDPSCQEEFYEFVDLSTVLKRIGNKSAMALEFIRDNKHRYRISFIIIVKQPKNEVVLCGIREI